MINFLFAKHIESVNLFLCQKNNVSFIDLLFKNLDPTTLFTIWNISNFDNLSNYISNGSNGLFEEHISHKNEDLILVRGVENAILDDKNLAFLKEISQNHKLDIYFYLDSEMLNATLKKLIQKNELNFIELDAVDKKTKSEIIQKYTQKEYPDYLNNLNQNVINSLSEIELVGNILDTIDFLVLSKSQNWLQDLNNRIESKPEIFRISISNSIKKSELYDLYNLFQNIDTNQLLMTILFSRMDGKPEYKDRLQNLIQTDYLSKTKSNGLLWAKLWLYDILKK